MTALGRVLDLVTERCTMVHSLVKCSEFQPDDAGIYRYYYSIVDCKDCISLLTSLRAFNPQSTQLDPSAFRSKVVHENWNQGHQMVKHAAMRSIHRIQLSCYVVESVAAHLKAIGQGSN